MPASFKAEVLSNILNDAKEAREKNVKYHKNTYEPEEYLKVRAETLAMSQMQEGDYLVPMHSTGAVEFDDNGNLKKIGRNRPAMLDLAYYTRNRYEIEKIIPANEKKAGLDRGTYILVVIGNPIVNAIADTIELPKTVKAYRFKREEVLVETGETEVIVLEKDEDGNPTKTEESPIKEVQKSWKYVGAEMIPSERVYKMTRQLNPYDMLDLINQVEDGIDGRDNIQGDSLDDIE